MEKDELSVEQGGVAMRHPSVGGVQIIESAVADPVPSFTEPVLFVISGLNPEGNAIVLHA